MHSGRKAPSIRDRFACCCKTIFRRRESALPAAANDDLYSLMQEHTRHFIGRLSYLILLESVSIPHDSGGKMTLI